MEDYTCCRYCNKGIFVSVEKRTMCRKNGLVPAEYVCPQYALDPFKIQVHRKHNVDFSKYEKEDYSIE